MNDKCKKIDVNLSSLLSLKAEILRKQEEVNKAKINQPTKTFEPKKTSKTINSDKKLLDFIQKKRISPDNDIFEKSKQVLEAKSRYYEKLVSLSGEPNVADDNCLLMFNHKKQFEDQRFHKPCSTVDSVTTEYLPKLTNTEIEYTDCLGRTRKCLKKDLKFLKRRDTELAADIQSREVKQNRDTMWNIKPQDKFPYSKMKSDVNVSEMCTSLVSKHDQMKYNWEKKEQDNLSKEDVHYQDLLFDEARQHGVGYYAFSTDNDERIKQHTALEEIRSKTLAAQINTEINKEQRDKITQERVRVAKNRQRARLGLPPFEDLTKLVSNIKEVNSTQDKTIQQTEKLQRETDKEDTLQESKRKLHVRPWDKIKYSVGEFSIANNTLHLNNEKDWKYKSDHKILSQEEWNEKIRNERNPYYAPPRSVTSSTYQSVPQLEKSSLYETCNSHKNKLLLCSDKVNETEINSNDQNNEYKCKNMNEVNLSRQPNYSDITSISVEPLQHPLEFRYFHTNKIKGDQVPNQCHLEESIEAGLKFLRNKSETASLLIMGPLSDKKDSSA